MYSHLDNYVTLPLKYPAARGGDSLFSGIYNGTNKSGKRKWGVSLGKVNFLG
jgi:hypothetical protein